MNKKSVENEIEIQKVLDDLSQEFSVTKETKVREQLSSEIESEQRNIHSHLRRENPFKENQFALRRAETGLKRKGSATIADLERDFRHFQALAKQTDVRIDRAFWSSDLQKLKENQKHQAKLQANSNKTREAQEERVICRQLLLQQWRKLLDEQLAKWEIETIQEFREKLLKKLKEWLKNLQSLADTLDELSIEPGLLFDLSKGNISLSDIEQLKKWVSYISKDKGVRELCDLMGRLRRAEKTKRQELVKSRLTVTEYVPDINSREEIVGVYLGKDMLC